MRQAGLQGVTGPLPPQLHREDGIENLVVFPMYTPNGSPDTRFEALITRTPWPEFVAVLERERYDNAKFVPVQLVDNTAGYDSECAVLFPETVSVAERPTNHFGAIFCDRESSRSRRSTLRGAEVLRIDLPPDAMALASSADLALETYILWDMVHDRWHSHGDLPFDPFMIRQRLPYWMYSLEELRVDLATYGTAGQLVRDGFPFARYIQYAIFFDRVLRFPITGNRVRNYDGLGGQLLFGYIHDRGVVRWTDNRLLIDWERVEGAVGELRALVEELYRHGIETSKVTYWIAAHDLVSRYVTPNMGRSGARKRASSVTGRPRAWIDRVLDDEFPLNMFYDSLEKKVATERRRRRFAHALRQRQPRRRAPRRPGGRRRGERGLGRAYGDDEGTAGGGAAARGVRRRRSVPGVQRHGRQRRRALRRAAAVRGRDLPGDRAHQRRRVRCAGAVAGAKLVDVPTPDGKLTLELVRSRLTGSATSTMSRRGSSRSRSRPSSGPSTRRPSSVRSPTWRTRPGCCCSWTAPGWSTPRRPSVWTCASSRRTEASTC